MDYRKDDAYYVQRITNDLRFIREHMKDVTMPLFEANPVLQDSMMFRLVQVSENAQKLTDRFRVSHPSIPWRDVYGLRNRIVHDYGAVDLQIVYSTLNDDVPFLLKELSGEGS